MSQPQTQVDSTCYGRAQGYPRHKPCHHFRDEETEAQEGEAPCLRSLSIACGLTLSVLPGNSRWEPQPLLRHPTDWGLSSSAPTASLMRSRGVCRLRLPCDEGSVLGSGAGAQAGVRLDSNLSPPTY